MKRQSPRKDEPEEAGGPSEEAVCLAALKRIQAAWRVALFLKKVRKAGFQQQGLSASTFKTEGNDTHYTDDALESRQSLRSNKTIVKWLKKYWDTFPSKGKTIERVEVIALQVKFCKVLFDPDDWSLDECKQAAETEWEREMGSGTQTMSREAFFDSLFEIVDVWTLEIDPAEYVLIRCFALVSRMDRQRRLGGHCVARLSSSGLAPLRPHTRARHHT
jgi:hypothetical protein